MNTVIVESSIGKTLEKQYCHITRNMSLAQIKRVEDLSDELFGESEFMHTARKMYQEIQYRKDNDFHLDSFK